jgi:hypothetical protein
MDGRAKAYKVKTNAITGSDYKTVERKARASYNFVAKQTKRTPYVKSKIFNKEKIFINLFWTHLNQKLKSTRRRRLKLFDCALDLLRNTNILPTKKKIQTAKTSSSIDSGEKPRVARFFTSKLKRIKKETNISCPCFLTKKRNPASEVYKLRGVFLLIVMIT